MIRVQLAGAADFAALLAAYAPSRAGQMADLEQEWVEQAHPVPHRAERSEQVGRMGDETGRGRAALRLVR